ncbi:MAG TPA: CocE/NonD family hydrolase, partial [Gaiellaceae bacterium]
GAAALWDSAMALITGPSAADLMLSDRVFRHLPLIDLDVVTIGRKVDYWRKWWEHQTNDEYWQQFVHRPEKVNVPIFQQGGWFDPYSGSHLRSFAGIGDRVPNRVLMGPWSHEEEIDTFKADVDLAPALTVIREHDLAFYDRFLKDAGNGWDDRPPLELYVLGANEWRAESEWPIAGTEPTPWYLHSNGRANTMSGDGTLSLDTPASGEPSDRFDYDPEDPVPTIGGNNSVLTMTQGAQTPILPGPRDQRVLERRDDVLCYTSEALNHDLEMIGPIEMVLYAASSAIDTDFIVRLSDVYPNGKAIFLAEGMLRARYRNSVAGESVEMLEPNEVAEFRIRCYPAANVFKRGHRLRLDVTSSSFPRFSRNLNTGEDVGTGTRMEVAHQTVLHTSAYPSHIVLPIIRR